MATYSRLFPIDRLAAWDATHPGNAVRALFDRWSLPGQKAVERAPLRLRLANGYLEFCVRGQQLAKLTLGQHGPRLSLPMAHVAGRAWKWLGDGSPSMQGFQEFDADGLADPVTSSLIADWINTAETYACAQQRFVDDLIAANPGVLNLEGGFPEGDLPDIERVPPPITLVIAQRVGDEPPSICLWEARSADNPDLRSERNEPLRISRQLAELQRWVTDQNRIAEVQRVTQDAAAQFLQLHRSFGAGDPGSPECVSIWKAVAELGPPVVAPQLGLVIGNYWPEGYREPIASGRMAQHAAKFAKNGRRLELERAGIRVHEVGLGHGGAVLATHPTQPVLT
ncbi:MAG: hypothetical protein P4M09_13275 [Devosia sp.]|nr:hypothetical protein [Devosia sp.]